MSELRFRTEEIDEMEHYHSFLVNHKIERFRINQMREAIFSAMLRFLAWEEKRIREEEFLNLVNWMMKKQWMYEEREILKREHWEFRMKYLRTQFQTMKEIRDSTHGIDWRTPAELMIGWKFQVRSLAMALFKALIALGHKPLLYRNDNEYMVVLEPINIDGWEPISI